MDTYWQLLSGKWNISTGPLLVGGGGPKWNDFSPIYLFRVFYKPIFRSICYPRQKNVRVGGGERKTS